MGLSIKHAETERKIRELAGRRDQSMTQVIHDTITEALERETPREAEVKARLARYEAFVKAWDAELPPGPFPTDREMDSWIYDDDGRPTR